jgi:predicted AlkP superfamily pyrophosphatase or phosphodiesterase
MRPLVVIDVVGLTPSLVGPDTPHLARLAGEGFQAELGTVLPAVTCTAQATLLTGLLPRDHGVVGNGWYFRDLAEVWFWRQSNRLVAGEKVWERCRRREKGFTCAKLFWWYNMYSSADYTVTPRPAYLADGRKITGLYTHPADLRDRLEGALGPFPLFHFWGPQAGIKSSKWIARCAEQVIESCAPHLALVYLPHLDYDLQRYGPDHPAIPRALRAVDRVAGRLIDFARGRGHEVLVLSEYGITAVSGAVSINRVLRQEGLLQVHGVLGRELLDPGASRAFAVADHQVAHVYVREPGDVLAVERLLVATPGVAEVLDRDAQRGVGLDHPRSGELVAVARPDRWFDYHYWLDDRKAPDFARTVDIHRKPGYDPCELFLDPQKPLLKPRIAWKLLRKALGFRYLMDVIPLDSSLVRGSHGRPGDDPRHGPLVISSSKKERTSRLEMTEVPALIEQTIFG